MEVIIGRDQHSRRLTVIRDGKTQMTGQPNSVPMDVSRQHASFRLLNKSTWEITNLNPRNMTFVNGMQVEKKVIYETDKVELGASHYLVDWNIVRGPKVDYVDIRPLQSVWEEFNQANIDIRKRQKNNGLLASVPMAISMFGGIITTISYNTPLKNYAIAFTIIALIIMVIGLYRRFTDNSIEEQEEIKKWFQQSYTCPKCKHFMGNEPYDVLIQNEGCRYCKAKFKK